ncbi:SAF domain-containing protein [Streptomyces sp. AJS327]|uniref:SAF domain-containing protein n=1 Tax=Streptomyces sp. AJS327 TaxID=2545265 RepID=UPI0021552D6A|nr:SAF domain-containing protein [Streptomyces sp. AJS327]
MAASDRAEVLVVARDVPAGKVIGREDLRTVRAAVERGVIPLDRRTEVVGHRARLPLPAGALVAPGMVGGRAAYPPVGMSQVTIGMEAGAGPSNLARGDRVALLPGPDQGAPSGPPDSGEGEVEAPGPDPDPVAGTVTGVREPASTGDAREVRVLVETPAVRRAVSLDRPRVVVLPAVGREMP